MKAQIQTARGTRDFLPEQVVRRQRILDVIRKVFEGHGFQPLETPALERLTTLVGKYGEEGDQLLFRIQKRGEAPGDESDLGLRYDLTVPLARVVAMYHGQLPMPFKRYQIQPVWRADRPQKGRFREFLQCDVDVVGSQSLTVDAELVSAAYSVLKTLGFDPLTIRINSRKVLRRLVDFVGLDMTRESALLMLIDKLDKIGAAAILNEFEQTEPPAGSTQRLSQFLELREDSRTDLTKVAALLGDTDVSGLAEVREVLDQAKRFGVPGTVAVFDPCLARGLAYYTGPIFEATVDGFPGSIAGGGRYDGLVGMFLGKTIPAVGISLGFERIFEILEDRNLSLDIKTNTDVLVTVWSEELRGNSVELAQRLRVAGFNVDLYPDRAKLSAQLKYAHRLGIASVAILGPEELDQRVVKLRNMRTGEQHDVPSENVSTALSKEGRLR